VKGDRGKPAADRRQERAAENPSLAPASAQVPVKEGGRVAAPHRIAAEVLLGGAEEPHEVPRPPARREGSADLRDTEIDHPRSTARDLVSAGSRA
jgi:hypothetical protein